MTTGYGYSPTTHTPEGCVRAMPRGGEARRAEARRAAEARRSDDLARAEHRDRIAAMLVAELGITPEAARDALELLDCGQRFEEVRETVRVRVVRRDLLDTLHANYLDLGLSEDETDEALFGVWA